MALRSWKRILGLGLLAAVLPLWLAFAEPQQKKPSKSGSSSALQYTAVNRDPALYAGSDACQTCHFEAHEKFGANRHMVTTLDAKRGVAWQGCEGCHGPGLAHVEAGGDASLIFSFATGSKKEATQRCLECHEFNAEHVNFARSAHTLNDVGCRDCHTIHEPKVKENLLQAASPQLCYTCHLEVRSEFSRPFRHRVNEGLVSCNDCHNPHGGFQAKQVRATAEQDAGCFQCHTEKRGPWVFEHAPVRTEGCATCHAPHGSSNPRMLKRSQVNLLCLDCHSASVHAIAPTPVGPAHNQMQKYQACTLCHTAIHGSNSSSALFQQ
jgi:DmsE family decaheme c-type cytochrome